MRTLPDPPVSGNVVADNLAQRVIGSENEEKRIQAMVELHQYIRQSPITAELRPLMEWLLVEGFEIDRDPT